VTAHQTPARLRARAGLVMARALVPLLLAVPIGAQATSASYDTTRAADTTARAKGIYTPLRGFKLVDSDQGDVNLKIYTYIRYLNQLGLDTSFVDSFGDTSRVDVRQDIQLQKVNIQLYGWLLDKRLRYFVYAWSSNTSQGLGAQVVLGGNLTFKLDDHFTFGGGIGALPGVRTTEGNFPLWLAVDNRAIADEFFRPSYSTGVWVTGNVTKGLTYGVMLANNLSQLGVDAGELDKGLNTWSFDLVWLPTTREFGTLGELGDFDDHKRLATRIGAHYTRSNENFQGQLSTDAFDNVQIRLSDGNVIFKPDLFGPGIRITDVAYHMGSADIGLKQHGFSLSGEYYWRKVDDLIGPGTAGLANLWDHGFQLQASGMAIPKRLQLYAIGSKVLGQHGNPWDNRLGVNWYPFSNQIVRLNAEYLYVRRSPVGGLSLPFPVGGNGYVIYSSFEIRP
jgi:hypothetical protein